MLEKMQRRLPSTTTRSRSCSRPLASMPRGEVSKSHRRTAVSPTEFTAEADAAQHRVQSRADLLRDQELQNGRPRRWRPGSEVEEPRTERHLHGRGRQLSGPPIRKGREIRNRCARPRQNRSLTVGCSFCSQVRWSSSAFARHPRHCNNRRPSPEPKDQLISLIRLCSDERRRTRARRL